MKEKRGLTFWLQQPYRILARPVVSMCMALSIRPNTITLLGLLMSLMTGYTIANDQGVVAVLLLITVLVFDHADGQLARQQNTMSPAGAYLDSVTDIIKSGIIHIGLAFSLLSLQDGSDINTLVILSALTMLMINEGLVGNYPRISQLEEFTQSTWLSLDAARLIFYDFTGWLPGIYLLISCIVFDTAEIYYPIVAGINAIFIPIRITITFWLRQRAK
jgi:phosphatidylglycerophosphate synthase